MARGSFYSRGTVNIEGNFEIYEIKFSIVILRFVFILRKLSLDNIFFISIPALSYKGYCPF